MTYYIVAIKISPSYRCCLKEEKKKNSQKENKEIKENMASLATFIKVWLTVLSYIYVNIGVLTFINFKNLNRT